MKTVKVTIIASIFMAHALTSFALSTVEEAIVERIKPIGEVCVTGESCTDTPAPEQVTGNPGKPEIEVKQNSNSVMDNYNKACVTCHAAGIAGAPKFGSSADWAPRIAKGKEALYQSARNGLPPAMPAKGMCFSCSDDDLKALVDYMLENSQ